MKDNNKQSAHGFTLVELSIVLVLIGLITGAVVGGQALVRSATIVSVGSELKSFTAAFNTFELQYDAIPGDFDQASDYWSTTSGDGNRLIVWNSESNFVWEHLRLSEILPRKIKDGGGERYRDSPHMEGAFYYGVLGDLYGSGDPRDSYVNAVTLGFRPLGDNGAVNHGVMTPTELRTLDKKIDDGVGDKGNVTGSDSPPPNEDDTETCAASGVYDVANDDSKSCRVIYWLD